MSDGNVRYDPCQTCDPFGTGACQGHLIPAAPNSNYWCCGECRPWRCAWCFDQFGEHEQSYHCNWFDERCPRQPPFHKLPPMRFGTILADPPWRFSNRTGKMAPEHRRLHRYQTMTTPEIAELPVAALAKDAAPLYLWCPNALLEEGLQVMRSWDFVYKTNIVWSKVRADGGPDGRGVGFYFRNVTELCLFGVRGSLRTREAGRRQANLIATRKGAHSVKPTELYDVIEACSHGPYLELFARQQRAGWTAWGDEVDG